MKHSIVEATDLLRLFYSLTIFRTIRQDTVCAALEAVGVELERGAADAETRPRLEALNRWSAFVHALSLVSVDLDWRSHLASLVLLNENPLTLAAERAGMAGGPPVPEPLLASAARDLEALSGLAALPLSEIASRSGFPEVRFALSASREAENADPSGQLAAHHNWPALLPDLLTLWGRGAGLHGKYSSFTWDSRERQFRPVTHPDPICLDDLGGYELPRSTVIENTRQFLDGFRANNIILYGDRGTGKSATVKAVARNFAPWGLRIIEVKKEDLGDYALIVSALRERALRYILFVDDLSFTRTNEAYYALKALLEGGIESRPENVIIYATSNRRHMVKEGADELSGEALQEFRSLADRFGLPVIFSAPDSEEYLAIVNHIAGQRGLKYESQQLREEALKWEQGYNGRSPRTARQFVDWYEGRSKK